MKKVYLACLWCLPALFSLAQKKAAPPNLVQIENTVMDEGRKLYQLEMAQTMGAEIFKQQLGNLYPDLGGYFPYKEGRFYKCIFYNKLANAQVLATLCFDSSFNPKRVAVNTTLRPMTETEGDLFKMSQHALDDVKRDTSFYKLYTNTSTSLIPLVEKNSRRVFVITKSLDSTAVLFGNDYQIDFDNSNYISSRKVLHNDLFEIEPAPNDPYHEEVPEDVMHKHSGESGEFMTATDVCILLLNQKKSKWQHHVVIGTNYVSVWYCDTSELQTVTKKAWQKLNKPDKSSKDDEKPVANNQQTTRTF